MVPHHKRHKNCARRFYMLGYVEGNGNRDSRNLSSFNSTLDQRDALMADRSGRCEQDHIRIFTFDGFGDVLRKSFL